MTDENAVAFDLQKVNKVKISNEFTSLEQKLQHIVSTEQDEDKRTIIEEEFNGFKKLYMKFLSNKEPSFIWDQIEQLPTDALCDYHTLETPTREKITEFLKKLVVVKLNGGLGTSMGCHQPKSVILVRDELSFIELIVQQVEHLNTTYSAQVPLVLMNSFNTDEEMQEIIRKYKDRPVDIHTFKQSCYPRICRESLLPIAQDCQVQCQRQAWYPPGHGDFYHSFAQSGLLGKFLTAGYEYIFLSNIDNLGATVDVNILSLLLTPGLRPEFLMEVCDKTPSDVKGGTLVHVQNKLRLLEIAQVPKEHEEDFTKLKFFNTNNLWIKLDAMERVLRDIDLEIIVNNKTIDKDVHIIQLETAAGDAMKNFSGALGIKVPRTRFLPVKKTSDLLLMMSNVYRMSAGSLVMSPQRQSPPVIKLGHHFARVKDFLARFASIPDLLALEHLEVSGDVTFGAGVSLQGTVIITADPEGRIDIPSGAILANKTVTGNLRILDR